MTSDRPTFDEAVAALVEACARGGNSFNDADALIVIYRALAPIHRVFPTIEPEAWQDLVDEAVLRFWKACLEGRIHEDQNPAGYLVQTARNLALDHVRSASRQPEGYEILDVASDDDAIAATVDATAGRQAIEGGLRAAWEAKDDTVVRVVLAWLEAASAAPGTTPSSRKVAERLGISHTAVNDAMSRFKRYLPKDPAGS